MTKRTSNIPKDGKLQQAIALDIVPINGLQTYAKNPRKCSERMMKALVESLKRFGMVQPVIVNRRTGEIVGGHQRVEAARRLGQKEVPVLYVDLNETDMAALNVALNKIEGEWDFAKLSALLKELDIEGLDMSTLGFDEKELSTLAEVEIPDDNDSINENELTGTGNKCPNCGFEW